MTISSMKSKKYLSYKRKAARLDDCESSKSSFVSTHILIYIKKGMSSTDAVRHFKYHLPKVLVNRHIGTLDPFAEEYFS